MLAVSTPDPRCTIRIKIDTYGMLVTSLAECSRCYRANKKTRILVGTVLDVEMFPKATTSVRRRTFVVAKFDLVGGDTNVATTNIRSVKLHTLEPLYPDTNGDSG